VDVPRLGQLLSRVLEGDPAAWQGFVASLEPELRQLLRRSRVMGALRESEDECRAVAVKVLSRLEKNDFRALRLVAPWLAAHPDKDLGDWIRIVAVNRARDHVAARSIAETLRSLTSRVGARPAFTDGAQARQVLEYAEGALTLAQLRALRLWIEGAGFDEVAAQLALPDGRAADKLVRAALARLRRRFAG
jgi:hypothetical protein